MASREERRLFAAIEAASPKVEAVCRHGFPRATFEVSRSFTDEHGVKRWYRKTVVDVEDCPDA